MNRGFARGGEQGATAVEYGAIIAGVIALAFGTVSLSGANLSQTFCTVGSSIAGQACPAPSPADTASTAPGGVGVIVDPDPPMDAGPEPVITTPAPTPTPTPSPSEAAVTPVSETSAPAPTATVTVTSTPTPTPDVPANSSGTMVFNTATVDQDQILSCLSARFNLSWYPSSWSNVTWPQQMTVDVYWSPTLDVYDVIPGSNGTWTSQLVEPGHLRLVRTGTFNSSGLQPEPEILLKKPTTRQDVIVTFVASAPNTPTVNRAAATTSWPY